MAVLGPMWSIVSGIVSWRLVYTWDCNRFDDVAIQKVFGRSSSFIENIRPSGPLNCLFCFGQAIRIAATEHSSRFRAVWNSLWLGQSMPVLPRYRFAAAWPDASPDACAIDCLPRHRSACLTACWLCRSLSRCFSVCDCRPAIAKALLPEEEKAGLDAKPEKKSPFVLVASKVETLEALEDFRRAVRKNAWEKAFKQIETLLAEPAVGLVPSKDGLLVPLATAVATDLAALPPGGSGRLSAVPRCRSQKTVGAAAKRNRPGGDDEAVTPVDARSDYVGRRPGSQPAGGRVVRAGGHARSDRCLAARARLSARQQPVAAAAVGQNRGCAGQRRALVGAGRGRAAAQAALCRRNGDGGGRQSVAADHVADLVARHQSMSSGRAGGTLPDLSFADDTEPVWQFRFEAKDC